MRFATMQDPSETWLVYDLISDLPAEIAGRPLIGLTKNEAEHLSATANAVGERLSHHRQLSRGQTGLAV